MKFNFRSQIWVETVIYTLIAFLIIGTVLTFAKPKIEEIQDRAILDQTIGLLENIDSLVSSVASGGAGNKRIIELGIKKGELTIDGENDLIFFEMESMHVYSEPGEKIPIGNIVAYTQKKGKTNIVNLTIYYSGKYNISYQDNDVESKTITKSATPYQMAISNEGNSGVGGKPLINIEII